MYNSDRQAPGKLTKSRLRQGRSKEGVKMDAQESARWYAEFFEKLCDSMPREMAIMVLLEVIKNSQHTSQEA